MPIYRITAPDGKTLQVTAPEGATQDEVLAHVQQNYNPARTPNVDNTTPLTKIDDKSSVLANVVKRLGSGAITGLQGMTFGLGDEARAAIGAFPLSALSAVVPNARSVGPSEAYDILQSKALNEVNQAKENYPLQTTGTEIAGNILSTLPFGASAAGKSLANWASSGSAMQKAGKAYLTAFPSTAAYLGATTEGGLSERASEAAKAPLYAIAAPVLSASFSGISSLADKYGGKIAAQALKKDMEAQGQEVANVSDKAMGKVIDRLRADFPDDQQFQDALQSYLTGNKSLIELAGNRTENLAKGAAQFPSGEAAAKEFIYPKIGQAPTDVSNAVKKYISNKFDYNDTIDTILEKGRAKAAPLYDQAYKSNPSIVSNEIDNILATPAGKEALGKARTLMQNDRSLMGLPDKELGDISRELQKMGMMSETQGGVASGLKLRTLDYVKQALDDQYQTAARSGDLRNAGYINNLKKSLVNELDNADTSGAYAKARAAAGDYLSAQKAADIGRSFGQQTPEDIRRLISSYTPTERDAFKVGVVSQLRKAIDTAARDPSLSQANIYQKILGSKWQKDQIKSIIGESSYNALENEMNSVKKIYQIRQNVLGGSPTASKQIAAQEFDDATGEMLQQVAQQGWKSVAADKIYGFVSRHFRGLSDKTAKEVSDILYATDPQEKLKIINRMKLSTIPQSEKQAALKAYFTIENIAPQFTKTGD